jgi:hypothetical protein
MGPGRKKRARDEQDRPFHKKRLRVVRAQMSRVDLKQAISSDEVPAAERPSEKSPQTHPDVRSVGVQETDKQASEAHATLRRCCHVKFDYVQVCFLCLLTRSKHDTVHARSLSGLRDNLAKALSHLGDETVWPCLSKGASKSVCEIKHIRCDHRPHSP